MGRTDSFIIVYEAFKKSLTKNLKIYPLKTIEKTIGKDVIDMNDPIAISTYFETLENFKRNTK